MALKRDTTWNRDDRDLLVELRTDMANVRNKLDSVDVQIKDINTGITGRLLHLEANTVMKLQFNAIEEKVDELIESRTSFRASIRVWMVVGGSAWALFVLAASIYFK